MADIQKARVKIEEAHAALTAAMAALEGEAPPAPAPLLEVYGTGGQGLNVREAPHDKARIVTVLREGATVREFERRDGWVRHAVNRWSHGDYLRPT